MEVFVSAPSVKFSNIVFPDGSVVGDVLNQYVQKQEVSSDDFYVITNGRLSCLEDPLQHGAVYHLEPRLCGGKGGFGSMLRALGAQIEKTTNREACRDLSGRRLRDVNHEKEMAEWLKKQADREVEKEQRRLERLQKKLTEPKHQFTDPEFQQQCHDLSERLEDSVLKGLQASSSGLVIAGDVSAVKRPNSDQSQQQQQQKKQKKMGSAAAARFWTGLDELPSSEEDDDDDDDDVDEEEPAPTSSTSCGATVVTMMMQRSPSAQYTCTDQTSRPSEVHEPLKTCTDKTSIPSEVHEPLKTCTDQTSRPSEGHKPTNICTDQTTRISEGQEPTKTCTHLSIRTSEESSCPEQQLTYPPLQLSLVSSVDQLETLGLDVLKQELMSRGLKCGGALSERAARLFSVRGLSPDQIDPALLAKPGKTKRK